MFLSPIVRIFIQEKLPHLIETNIQEGDSRWNMIPKMIHFWTVNQ